MFDSKDRHSIKSFLTATTLSVEPEETGQCYIYLPYPTDYTQTLRLTVQGHTLETIKFAVRALDIVAEDALATHATYAKAYASVLRTILVGIAIIDDSAVVLIEPVDHHVYDTHSGMTVTLLDTEVCDPVVALYSGGTCVFEDKVGHLLLSKRLGDGT